MNFLYSLLNRLSAFALPSPDMPRPARTADLLLLRQMTDRIEISHYEAITNVWIKDMLITERKEIIRLINSLIFKPIDRKDLICNKISKFLFFHEGNKIFEIDYLEGNYLTSPSWNQLLQLKGDHLQVWYKQYGVRANTPLG